MRSLILTAIVFASLTIPALPASQNHPVCGPIHDGNLKKVKKLVRKYKKIRKDRCLNGAFDALQMAINYRRQKVAIYLIKIGAPVNGTCKKPAFTCRKTPLEFAAERDLLDVVKVLVKRGAFVRMPSTTKEPLGKSVEPVRRTALARSIRYASVAKYLLSKGADPNFVNKNGTPLFVAISQMLGMPEHAKYHGGLLDIAKQMMKSGVKINATNSDGLTAYYYASEGKTKHARKLAKILSKKGAKKGSLQLKKLMVHKALKLGRERTRLRLIQLLKGGADPNEKDSKGMTPLHKVIYKSYKTNVMRTPALRRRMLLQKILLELLLEYKANPKLTDNKGNTPLHTFCLKGRGTGPHDTELIQIVVKAGADVNATNEAGETPLHLAAVYSQTNIVKLLLELGANKDAKTKAGKTPVDVAVARRNRHALVAFDAKDLLPPITASMGKVTAYSNGRAVQLSVHDIKFQGKEKKDKPIFQVIVQQGGRPVITSMSRQMNRKGRAMALLGFGKMRGRSNLKAPYYIQILLYNRLRGRVYAQKRFEFTIKDGDIPLKELEAGDLPSGPTRPVRKTGCNKRDAQRAFARTCRKEIRKLCRRGGTMRCAQQNRDRLSSNCQQLYDATETSQGGNCKRPKRRR